MCYHFRYLGFILCFVFGTHTKETVKVSSDITVKATPSPLTNDADRVNVTLNCTGSRSDFGYYIMKRISWTFISSSGEELGLTEAFYVSRDASHLFEGPEARFSFRYSRIEAGYSFDLSITGVTNADNGVYRCSVRDEDGQVIDSKDVRLTVVNPVETVEIELYDAQQNFIAKSSFPVIRNAEPFNIKPGQYMVKCIASGSNHKPEMNLFLNELKTHASVNTEEDTSAEFKSYVGALEVKNLTISGHSARQALVCTANIPGDYYESTEARLDLFVLTADEPSFVCENATAALAERNCQLRCKVTDQGQTNALACDGISWLLGNTGQRIGYEQKWSDPNQKYDTIESFCKKTNGGLVVILDIFTVNSKILEETFFIVYGNGENAYRHPIKVNDITSARLKIQ